MKRSTCAQMKRGETSPESLMTRERERRLIGNPSTGLSRLRKS